MRRFWILILAAMLLGLASCASHTQEPPGLDMEGVAGIVPVDVTPLSSIVNLDFSEPLNPSISQGANDFAFRLAHAMMNMHNDDNFVMSPMSVWLPLAALANATNPELLSDLLEAIGAAGHDVADINIAAARMLYELMAEAPIHIANGIFAQYRDPINPDFAQTFADFFLGEMMNLNFMSPYAADVVNTWAADNTEGLIDNILRPEDFTADLVAIIINAIYWSDDWAHAFDPAYT